jgi:hypothetical protein
VSSAISGVIGERHPGALRVFGRSALAAVANRNRDEDTDKQDECVLSELCRGQCRYEL